MPCQENCEAFLVEPFEKVAYVGLAKLAYLAGCFIQCSGDFPVVNVNAAATY